jgi:hypothetical protein
MGRALVAVVPQVLVEGWRDARQLRSASLECEVGRPTAAVRSNTVGRP